MWALKTCLYFGLFWLACFLALVNPIWGVVNYTMAYQTNPMATWWGQPLHEVGMRFSLLAALFTALGMFFGRKHVPLHKPVLSAWEICAVLLVGVALANLLLGVSINHRTDRAIEKFWKMMVFVLILSRLASNRRHFRILVWTFVVGSLYIGYDAFTAGPRDFALGRLNRIGGPDFATSSGTAAHLSAMLPLIGAAFLIARNWRWRLLALASGAFTFNAIVLCRTRSAFLGLMVGVAAALLMAPKARRFRIHALLVIGGLLAYSLTDANYWDRMATLADREALQQDGAAAGRTAIWQASLNILADHPIGIGVGNFARVIGDYDERYAKRSTHNTLVVCFVELGVHGGLIFLLMVALSFWYLYRSYRLAELSNHPLETKYLAYGLLIAFVTYFTTGLGTERFYCESFWWIFVLPVPLYRLVRGEVLAGEAARVPRLDRAPAIPLEFTAPLRHVEPAIDRTRRSFA